MQLSSANAVERLSQRGSHAVKCTRPAVLLTDASRSNPARKVVLWKGWGGLRTVLGGGACLNTYRFFFVGESGENQILEKTKVWILQLKGHRSQNL